MSYKWDDELTKKFLTLYRKHKCLWNPYSPNYRNCSVKNEAFEIVVQELNVPGIRISECLQQIEVVREKYKQEQLKAEKELKSGKLYTSKVPWFNLMSQMLCEVINDEENFSERPVKILPCTVIKDQQSKGPKPEKYVESKSKQNDFITSREGQLEHNKAGLRKPYDGQSINNDWQSDSETLRETNGPWNKCPSCGWEEEKNKGRTHKGAEQFDNCKEKGVQIDPELEVPLRFEKTNTLDTVDDIGEVNQPTPAHPCDNEMNDLNWKMRRQESNVKQNRKRVKITQISSGIEPQKGSRGKWDSTLPTKFKLTEDKIPPRVDTDAINTLQVMSLKENNVHCPRMCSNHIANIDPSQHSEKQLRNLDINQTNHRIDKPSSNSILYQSTLARQSQPVSEFESDANGTEDANRCNLCIRQYAEKSKKYSMISEDDKYEVCSRFKIVIPSSDREDQSLEITGYEVRVMNPQLSKYIVRPSSETPKLAIGNAECACRNEFSAPQRTGNLDSARYSSLIKLDVNYKSSKETEARKQSCASGTTYTRQVTDAKNDRVSGIETQHRSFSNKKTQTDSSHENESIQTSKDMETSKINYLKSMKDQGCTMDSSSLNEKSCQVTTVDENEKLISQHQNTSKYHPAVSKDLSDCKADPQLNKSSLPVEKFNNTKIFLNIIVKLLESDDTHKKSEDLHRTLDTMLDRYQHGSLNSQRTMKDHVNHNTKGMMYNDTSISTQYKSLALNPAPVNRQVKDINSQKSTNKTLDLDNTPAELWSKTVELDDTMSTNNTLGLDNAPAEFRSKTVELDDTKSTNKTLGLDNAPAEFRSKTVELDDTNSTNKTLARDDAPAEFRSKTVELDDTSIYLKPTSLTLGEPNNQVTEELGDGNKWNSGTANEKTESMNERGTRNRPPASLLEDTSLTSNSAADSDLNYTNEFFNNKPTTSSPRKIEEHGTSTQLAKDFLDVIKYTMMMDGIPQVTENHLRDNDDRKKPNRSTKP